MSKKETAVLLFSAIVIVASYLFLRKFEFLMTLGLVLMVLSYWLLFNRKHLKFINYIFIVFKFVVSVTSSVLLVVCSYILYNGNKHRQIELDSDADYVLVLGSRLEDEKISEVLKLRLDKSIEYYNTNKDVTFIVSGGPGVNSCISEAEAMKKYLVDNGVDEASIVLEPKAQSTFENIKFTKEMLASTENKAVSTLVITSDFHIARALMLSESFNLDAYGLSSATPNNIRVNYIIREILAFVKDFIKVNIYKFT